MLFLFETILNFTFGTSVQAKKMKHLTDPLILTFLVFWIIKFYLFGMQRATLRISRHHNVEWRGFGELLLPKWYKISWIFIYGNYVVLMLIAIIIDWKIALILAFFSWVLSSVLPIPYRFLYRKVFRKRTDEIIVLEPQIGRALKEMLEGTGF